MFEAYLALAAVASCLSASALHGHVSELQIFKLLY
jgi:hypothetical protein